MVRYEYHILQESLLKLKLNSILSGVFQALFSFVIGGMFGLICFMSLLYFSRIKYGLDASLDHGISEGRMSRLGGLSICLSIIVCFLLSVIFDQRYYTAINLLGFEWIALAIGFVGLFEDIKQGFSPYFRLLLTILVFAGALAISPDFIPDKIHFYFLSDYLNHPYLLVLASIFLLAGFTHAGNMVDGANGLLAITVISPLALVYSLTGEAFYLYLCLCLLVFTFFNVTTGKIFLGDFGAYFFSSLAMLSLYYLYDAFEISVWMLVALVSYPCLEIVRSIIERLERGRSPLLSDNNHAHNHVHRYFRNLGLSPLVANSMTGILIGVVFSTLPFLLYLFEFLTVTSNQWIIVIIFEAFALWGLLKLFTRNIE